MRSCTTLRSLGVAVAEASGFDRTARLGETGHKERTHWLAGGSVRKDDDEMKSCSPTSFPRPLPFDAAPVAPPRFVPSR